MANPHLYHEGHDIGVDRRFLVNMGRGGEGLSGEEKTTEKQGKGKEKARKKQGKGKKKQGNSKEKTSILLHFPFIFAKMKGK